MYLTTRSRCASSSAEVSAPVGRRRRPWTEHGSRRLGRVTASLALAAAGWALVIVTLAPVARSAVGDLEITRFDVTSQANPIAPDPLQAGAHPDLRLLMRFCGSGDPAVPPVCSPSQGQAHLRKIVFQLPRGLWANVTAVPQCRTDLVLASACPPQTVVGQLNVQIAAGDSVVPISTPLYNAETTGSELARLVTLKLPPGAPLSMTASADSKSGYRLSLTTNDIPGPTLKVAEIQAVLEGIVGGRPLIANPTSCDPATTGLEVSSWETATVVRSESTFHPQRCEAVPFAPTLTTTFDAPAPGGSSGEWEVAVEYPCADSTSTTTPLCREHYENDPIWPSELKHVELTLPEGVGVAPAAAKRLDTCSWEQFGVDDERPAACPDGSRLGSLGIESPVLPSRLEGELFFGPPTAPGRPTPESPWHVFLLAAKGGLQFKLVGRLTLDEGGRVEAVLRDLPRLPLTRVELHLTGGGPGRTPILTPPLSCGEREGDAVLTDWNDRSLSERPLVAGTQGCLSAQFEPALVEASVEPTQAGSSSSARIVITRPGGQRLLKSMSVSLPKGANGRLAAVSRCPLSQARAAACDEASRIGSVLTTVGSGDDLVSLPGSVYLAGASAPGDLGTIATVIPVRYGPVDLGPMVILARAQLRPSDAGVEIGPVELPRVFEGVPLLLTRIELAFDRPGFLWNPTGCEPRPLRVTLASDDGQTISLRRPVAATGCDRLPFAPKLRLITGERGLTGTDSHPPLRAIINHAAGQSAIQKAVIAIPDVGMNIPQLKRPDAVCQAAELRVRDCPPLSLVGAVKVNTPLLSFPLSGPVFAVPEPGSPLPSLAMILHGEGLVLQLRARNDIQGMTFEALPDIPISRLKLRINGGGHGMLTAFADLCGRKPPRAESTFSSQSGRIIPVRPELIVNGCLERAAMVVARSARVSRLGVARVKLRCRRSDRCDGLLSLRAVGHRRSPGTRRRGLRLGVRYFRLQGGRTGVIELRLTAAGRRAVMRHRKLVVRALVRVGNSRTSRRIALEATSARRSRRSARD
jgi:hypothetical protein